MNIKIILVDDHPMVRLGVAAMLNNQPDFEILGQYEKITQLTASINALRPDIVLLDLQLSDGNSESLISNLKRDYPQIKILVLSSNDNIHNIKLILNKGADGYILKNTEQDFLVQAIRDVYHNDGKDKIISAEVAKNLKRLTAKDADFLSNPNYLTPREQQVLQLMARELTSHEIGALLHLSQRTVESYRLILMQKLDVKNMIGMVKKAIMLGLIKE